MRIIIACFFTLFLVFAHAEQGKILLNAESFGFGPSAAIAELFPYLRESTETLSYIGSGHTLDFQSKLPYDCVYELKGGKEEFAEIAKDYDIFITASDFEKAEWAKDLGMTLIIYDPLTWYWPAIPEVVSRADLYIAQNFFGVTERIFNEPQSFPKTCIVPAILSGICSADRQTDSLLVNLGGLNNPYMNPSDIDVYAQIIFSIMHEHVAPQFAETHYVTNKAIVQKVQHICPVTTMLPCEVQECLSASKLALMTSGLGNLYEASAMGKRVVWLPPANDTQGQQVVLLERYGMIDARVDWSDIFEEEINYFAPQQEVLQKIAILMRRLGTENEAQNKFAAMILKKSTECKNSETLKLAQLAEKFDVNGAKLAAVGILKVKELRCTTKQP